MRKVILALLFMLTSPINAAASTVSSPMLVTYSLTGSALTGCHYGSRFFAEFPCGEPEATFVPRFNVWDGQFTISEAILGQSLRSSSISIQLPTRYDVPDGITRPWQAIVSSTLQIGLFESCCGGELFLETDDQRRPVRWAIEVLDGPPDRGTFFHGLSYREGSGIAYTGPSGIMSLENVAPIPVPPAVALLAGGLLTLGGVRFSAGLSRRLKRSTTR
jgi:hypothetical protein